MKVLPPELWMQVFQGKQPKDALKQLTTCRLFHSLLEPKVYEDIKICRAEVESPSTSQAMKFLQTLKARPILFSLVRKLRLDQSEEYKYDDEAIPEDTYWKHPVLWQLGCFSHLRSLELVGFHIDVACFIAIGSPPRLEHLGVERCDLDAALLDAQGFRGNTISKLSLAYPEGGDAWAALVTPGLRAISMESFIHDGHVNNLLRGLLSCDLLRTLTKFIWTLDGECEEDLLSEFMERCVQLEFLSITCRIYPDDDAEKRSQHFAKLSSGSLPMLSIFEGSAEYAAAIVAGRPVHNVSLQLWDDTPEDVLLALQFSKGPVTRLELLQGRRHYGDEGPPADIGLYLEHVPKTIEILSLNERFDKEKLQSWIPDLSNLSNLQTIECAADLKTFTQLEAVRLLSEACPSIRKILLDTRRFDDSDVWEKWMRRNDGGWERYPVDWKLYEY